MVLAEAPHSSLKQELSPFIREFLRFYGTVCSVPSVSRFATQYEAATFNCWVKLSDDDEAAQDAIYDALRRYLTADIDRACQVELHVLFADEDISVIPADADTFFVRE